MIGFYPAPCETGCYDRPKETVASAVRDAAVAARLIIRTKMAVSRGELSIHAGQ